MSTRTDTRFPYTRLFRSQVIRHGTRHRRHRRHEVAKRSERNRKRTEAACEAVPAPQRDRSAEHTSELQSLMRISYDVFCLTKKRLTEHIWPIQIHITPALTLPQQLQTVDTDVSQLM